MSTDPMAEIRASFFIECEELMESLQDALVILDENGGDSETINVVFRAVHSIKGGAGAFGLDALVAFAHQFETVLDELRSGRIEAGADAVRLFFKSADLLQDHARTDRGPLLGGGHGTAPSTRHDAAGTRRRTRRSGSATDGRDVVSRPTP